MTTYGTAASLTKPVHALGILFILLAGTLTAPAASAADDASGFITDLGRHAIAIMNDPGLSAADRQHRFETLMAEDFDLPKIAQFVLGTYWRQANETERQQFTTAFGDYMTGVYSTRFAEYSAQSFRVTTQLAASNATTVVSSEITRLSSGEEIDLDWIVAKTPGSYKVIDITAGGTSLSRAQREEFSSVVHRNGDDVSKLIRQLQLKSTELASSQR
ncbi:MAG TPA: ABC transporter substrate-binding protein [Aliidongia sp.]|nr:ABC transporter substrate-binding protein [Aliidongia sp.]